MENKKENRAFNEMYIAAKKRLEGKNPTEIARNSGAEFCFDQAFLHQAGYKINQIARSTGSRAAFLRMGEGKKDISQWILDA